MKLEASSLSSAMIIKSIVTRTYIHDHARYNNASIDGLNEVSFIQGRTSYQPGQGIEESSSSSFAFVHQPLSEIVEAFSF